MRDRFTNKKTVQEAVELTARLSGELKPAGNGAEQPRVAVIVVSGLQPGKLREAAARLAQRRWTRSARPGSCHPLLKGSPMLSLSRQPERRPETEDAVGISPVDAA